MSDLDATTRTCPRCKLTLPLDAFGPNRSRASGRQTYCRPCMQDIQRNRRAPAQEALRLAREARLSDPSKCCSICGEVKAKEGGFYHYGRGDGYRAECKACTNEKARQYAATKADPEAKKRWERNGNLQRYGLNVHTYQEIFDLQGGLCAVCGRPEERISHYTQRPRRLAVDHCHVSGRVRGLLCSFCNTALGQLREDRRIVAALDAYLAQHQGDGGVAEMAPSTPQSELT